MTTKRATFLVTEADDETAVLRDVDDGQVHPLSENPGLEGGAVVEATLTAEPPLEVTWTADVASVESIAVERSSLEPTRQVRERAAESEVGDLSRIERAGEGEVHVLSVPEERVDEAATDVVEDAATVERAARLGATRVEVRTGDGLVSVRYLPD